MSEEHANRKAGTGFSGLDALVSDVSVDIPKAAAGTARPHPGHNSTSPHAPHQKTSPEPAVVANQASTSGVSTFTVIRWILAILILLFVSFSNIGSDNAATTSPSSESPAPPDLAPTPETAPDRLPRSGTFHVDTEKPPVGSDLVLSVQQLRYCRTEEIRIETFEGLVDNHLEGEIDLFNSAVNDYNSRCGQFRYHSGDLEQAKRDVEASRPSIISGAKLEWTRESAGLEMLSELSPHTFPKTETE